MYNYYDYDYDRSYDYDYEYDPNDELYHFGVKGMKWGIRRFQNRDGSPTTAGRGRYGRRGVNWKRVARTAAIAGGVIGGGYLAYKNKDAIGRAAKGALSAARNYDYRGNARALKNRIVNAGRRTWNSATQPYGSLNKSFKAAPGKIGGGIKSAFKSVRGFDYKGAAKGVVNNVRNYDYRGNGVALKNRIVNAGRRTWNSATQPYGSLNKALRAAPGKITNTARRVASNSTVRRTAAAVGAGAVLGGAGSYGYQRVRNSRRRRRR